MEIEAVPVPKPPGRDLAALRERARAIFGDLPDEAASESNPVTEEKITLGRMLYFDTRSRRITTSPATAATISRTSASTAKPTSPGHKGQRGDRNSPTVYNAALHLAQFWDGRAADVEAQAKGPVLNPIEMAMPAEDASSRCSAFPATRRCSRPPSGRGGSHHLRQHGAGHRRLRAARDHRGPLRRLRLGRGRSAGDEELAGLETFMDTGCTTCHMGPHRRRDVPEAGPGQAVPHVDPGRSRSPARGRPLLLQGALAAQHRETGPYFHDGSIASLDEAVRIMGDHQLGMALSDEQVPSIDTFLGSLSGTVDAAYVATPELPESGPDTPAPDPT